MEKIIEFFSRIDKKKSRVHLALFTLIPLIMIADTILHAHGLTGKINGTMTVNELLLMTAAVSGVCICGIVLTCLGMKKRKNEQMNRNKVKRR